MGLDIRSEAFAVETFKGLLDVARKNFEKDGHVVPVLLALVTRNPQTREKLPEGEFGIAAIAASFGTEEEKDAFSENARAILRKIDAFGCVFISESWTYNTQNREVVEEQRRKYGPSIRASPLRKEIVMASMEHCSWKGTRVAMADIVREIPGDENSPGVVKDFEFLPYDSIKGRMAGFLPGARGN